VFALGFRRFLGGERRSSISVVLADDNEDSSSSISRGMLAIVGINSAFIVESPLKAKLRKALALSDVLLRVWRRGGDARACKTLEVS
jgi:hypothetical protein